MECYISYDPLEFIDQDFDVVNVEDILYDDIILINPFLILIVNEGVYFVNHLRGVPSGFVDFGDFFQDFCVIIHPTSHQLFVVQEILHLIDDDSLKGSL